MGAPAKKPSPIWVRANPRQLPADEIVAIRQTAHLTDVPMPRMAYRALIRAGHRYVGELAYVEPGEVRYYEGMILDCFRQLTAIVRDYGIEIGGRHRERVYVPE